MRAGPGADGGSQEAGPFGVNIPIRDDGCQRSGGKIEEDEQPMPQVCIMPDDGEPGCAQQIGPDVMP